MDPKNFMTWRGPCLVCGKVLRHGTGIFCGNFLRHRGPFPPCLAVWCGKCYREHPQDPFPIQTLLDDGIGDDEELETEEDLKERFRHGRDGDHLMGIPFECDLCHFRNVCERDPLWNTHEDTYTLLCIRRANLDAMWSREPSTVSSNLSRCKRDYYDLKDAFSFKDPLPILGRDDFRDKAGMKCALITLHAGRCKGKYHNHLQWDSTRKTPTWWNNAYEAGEGAAKESVFAADEKKMYVSGAPTSSKWFPRFMLGENAGWV